MRGRSRTQIVAWVAIAVAVVGVFTTWLTADSVTLNGIEGPNNGWLVVLLAPVALVCVRPMERGSWIGVAGVVGAAAVMVWTVVESWRDGREVLDASVSYGLLLVLAASLALGGAGVARAVELARERRRHPPSEPI